MFLFKRFHNFAIGIVVSLISVLSLIVAGGRLSDLIYPGDIGDIAVTTGLLAIGLTTTALEQRGTLVPNSYICIIGKSFYIAGFVSVMVVTDSYPWYVGLIALFIVLLIPFKFFPNNFFWAQGEGSELA